MERRNRIEQQVAAIERLYLAERTRRDVVRNALAVPVAALGFATFGYGVLWQVLRGLEISALPVVLAAPLALLPLLALTFFVLAALKLNDFQFDKGGLDPRVLDFDTYAEDVESVLIEESGFIGSRLARFRSEAAHIAACEALEELGRRYLLSFDVLDKANESNLKLLRSAFTQLVLAVCFLLGSIATALLSRVYVDFLTQAGVS